MGKNITWKDVRALSESEFNRLKSYVKEEEEQRTKPEFETVEAIYFDDGSEGWYMDAHDFEEKAREIDKYANDLMGLIIDEILNHSGNLTITKEKFTKDSFHNETFWGKENPYQEELDKLNLDDDDY